MLARGWPLRASKTRIRKSLGTSVGRGAPVTVTQVPGGHPPTSRTTLIVSRLPPRISARFLAVRKPGDFTVKSYIPAGRSKDNIPSLLVLRFGRALGNGSMSTSAFGTMPPVTSVTRSTIESFWGACSVWAAWEERPGARAKTQRSRGLRRYHMSEKLARTGVS